MRFIEIRGKKEVLIDGMSTVLEYSDDRIVVYSEKSKIVIKGNELELLTMNEGRLSIQGKIIALEFL